MNVNTAFDTRLEERLRRSEVLRDSQISEARDRQKEAPLSLAEALVELDFLSASEVDQIISSMQELRTVKLEEIQIDPEAVKHVPRQTAIACRCIPIRRTGNTLVVAASDADINRVRVELRAVTDFDIVLLVAEHDALEHALFVYYGDEPSGRKSELPAAVDAPSTSPWTIRSPWPRTFEFFADHSGCEHAREIAKQVASGNWDGYNSPIMFVGDELSGKSHVLEAIKNYCKAKDPTMRGVLCDGHELRALISDYSVSDKLQALRFELRECSLLMIDDFAAAWGDELTESEIASNFAALKAQGAAIVVTMTNEDYVSQPISPALRSAIEGGTVAHMEGPDAECLRRIVEQRCVERSSDVCASVLSAISTGAPTWTTIRTLATALLLPKA